ncbi:acetylxylan esterase [Verrucosispora sp. WMMD703]|uniref:Acetylxylan esterase n=1 Tax=Micromonospora sediminimaris TaxID=547162 RepID=A0A9W5UQ48_9ACTN|nr:MULTISPECIES: acetylxylan esterase [Micromonospora]WFE48109.1 acetylxylan esterase [Verrucosispora sp. WMMD1129]GIJ32620.1 acetylxylan esterase [Micromonospora sediminimaris]SFD17713.1 cephalosporin-C deacetylase [Micromonospora sediminimaris]
MPLFDLPLAQLRQYTPAVAEPADFDTFWQSTLDAATQSPVLLDLRPEPTDLRLVDSWDVTFAGFGGDPVRAWYNRPAGVDEALPVIVEYVGYGRGRGLPHERLTWPVAGYAHLLMDARGQSGQYGAGDTPDPHGAAPGGPSPVTRGIMTPEGYYYRRLITDAVRAVQAARALPGVDPRRVVAAGNSQGGGLSLAVAGLVSDLAAVLTTAPFLCHPQRALEITEVGVYGEIVNYLAVNRDAEPAVRRTLSYVDGVSFARRANAPVHFGIGLRDMVCPPSTGFAAYNHYGATVGGPPPERTMHVYPFNGHEHGDATQVRRQLRWLADVLGEETTDRSDGPKLSRALISPA